MGVALKRRGPLESLVHGKRACQVRWGTVGNVPQGNALAVYPTNTRSNAQDRGRGAGEGGQNPTGAMDVALAQDRWSHIPGEPCVRHTALFGGQKRQSLSESALHRIDCPKVQIR